MPAFKNGLCKVGAVYHYCFRVRGRQYKGSTRASDRATAEKVLQRIRQEAILGKGSLRQNALTVRELVLRWLETHRPTHSPKHLRSVEQVTRMWVVPDLGTKLVDQVTTEMVLELRRKMLDAGRSPNSANLLVRILKLLWGFAVRLGYLSKIPFELREQKVQRRPRPTVPASLVRDYLVEVDRSRNPHVGAMVRVMVGMGLRESEVLGMRWEWFAPEQRTYTVGKSKGRTTRSIPVPDWLWDHLATMKSPLSPWVFPAEDGQPHRPTFLRKPLKRAAESLGLGRVSAHRLRATFATLHAEAGTPITDIQGLLGHKSITTTMIYIEQTLDARRRAQEALSKQLGLA